jgi:hypothetical protein
MMVNATQRQILADKINEVAYELATTTENITRTEERLVKMKKKQNDLSVELTALEEGIDW